MNLLRLPALRVGGVLTYVGQMTFLDKRFIHDLLVEMRECLDLAVKEGLDGLDIQCTRFHCLADVLEHLSNAGLGILELVLNSLAIEVGQVGYGTDSG